MAPYLALRETPHGPYDDSPAEEEPSQQTPVSPTRRTMKIAKVGITLQMSINQFALAI